MFQSLADFIKTAAAVLLIGLLLVVGGVVGLYAADSLGGPKAADFSNVTFQNAAGDEVVAYLNIPQPTGLYPAVIMLPDAWGLTTDWTRMANSMAEEGLAVLLVDIYQGAATNLGLRAFVLSSTISEAQTFTDIQAALDYLRAHERILPDKIGIVGFDYSGDLALRFAAQNPQISAAAMAYGEVITDPAIFGDGVTNPILGIFAADDDRIPPEVVETFGSTLEAAGVEYQIGVYEDVGRGFIRLPEITIFNSGAYNAWYEIINFFRQHLDRPPD